MKAKISMLGDGYPILNSKQGYWRLPSDKRLSKNETKKVNQQEELAFITFQKRLLQLEEEHKEVEEGVRDSCEMYVSVGRC